MLNLILRKLDDITSEPTLVVNKTIYFTLDIKRMFLNSGISY